VSPDIIDELLDDARERMGKSIDAIRHEFGSVRTGRASPALLDRISVEYYGTQTPLKQLATIAAPEARLLTIHPYDKGSIKAIERAILESDVGLTPSNDGQLVRLAIPELTRLLAAGRSELDQAKRKAIYDQVQQVALEQVPACFLVLRTQAYAMQQNVQGFHNLPGQLTFYSGYTLEDAYLT